MGRLEDILKQHWGYDQFRPLQREIITSVLEQKDTLALLPTGAGKSLCYQLPAIISKGFCLVVSPLIALMRDQVARLKQNGIQAATIYAGMHYNDVRRTLDNMLHGPIKLLYVSPERLQTELFREYLPEFDISLIAVDEAHCISQWGHDFRPDYLQIARLRTIFSNVPVLALTASATPAVQSDIVEQLQLKEPALFKQSFKRDNLFYNVSYSENKANDTLRQLDVNKGTSIIYCRSRKQTETLTRSLAHNHYPAVVYHAGMTKDKREDAQTAWMQDKTPIMVATTAFGMGIDKANVRMVLHYDAPEHLEAYYQESGRAGRDEKPATTTLLYNATDITRLKDSTQIKFPPENYLKQVYQAIAEYLQIPIGVEPNTYFAFDLNDFCKRFGLEAVPVANALRLLEQEGLWTISDAVFHPATVQFTCERRVLDQLQQTYPDLGYVTTGLLRLYGTVFHYPTPIRIGGIAKYLKLKKDITEQLLEQLQKMEILEYKKPLEGEQLYFHHTRVDSRHLLLDLQRIHNLRKQHQARTDAMINFLNNTEVCRQRILLSYFGEETDKDCGHCDVCNKKQTPNMDLATLREELLAHLSKGQINIQQLTAMFPATIKNEVISLIRSMADDETLQISLNGTISFI